MIGKNSNYQLDINFDREGYLKQGVSILSEYQKSHYEAQSSYSTFKEQKLIEKALPQNTVYLLKMTTVFL